MLPLRALEANFLLRPFARFDCSFLQFLYSLKFLRSCPQVVSTVQFLVSSVLFISSTTALLSFSVFSIRSFPWFLRFTDFSFPFLSSYIPFIGSLFPLLSSPVPHFLSSVALYLFSVPPDLFTFMPGPWQDIFTTCPGPICRFIGALGCHPSFCSPGPSCSIYCPIKHPGDALGSGSTAFRIEQQSNHFGICKNTVQDEPLFMDKRSILHFYHSSYRTWYASILTNKTCI